MRNLAPHIIRQRLMIEGFYEVKIDEKAIRNYFDEITSELNLRTYGEPTIHSTGGSGKEINQGFDAFIPLIDSGISLYVWASQKFFSVVIYTCKAFDETKAKLKTKDFFKSKEVETLSF